MFAANVFEGVAYLMDNAELDTCVGEYALGLSRQTGIKFTFKTLNHIACTCAKGIHVDNLICHTFCKDCLVLFDRLWFKGPVTVTGRFYGALAIACLYLLRHLAVTAIAF